MQRLLRLILVLYLFVQILIGIVSFLMEVAALDLTTIYFNLFILLDRSGIDTSSQDARVLFLTSSITRTKIFLDRSTYD